MQLTDLQAADEWHVRRRGLIEDSRSRPRSEQDYWWRRPGSAVESPSAASRDRIETGELRRSDRGEHPLRDMQKRFLGLADGAAASVVKVVGFGAGSGAKRLVSYVARDGQLKMENERGEILRGAAVPHMVVDEWAVLMPRREQTHDFVNFEIEVTWHKGAEPYSAHQLAQHAFGDRAFAIGATRTASGMHVEGVAVVNSPTGGRLAPDGDGERATAKKIEASTGAQSGSVTVSFYGAGHGPRWGSAQLRRLVDRFPRSVHDERGEAVDSRVAASRLVQRRWRALLGSRAPRDTLHLIISAGKGNAPLNFEDSVREFMAQEFKGHRYIFAVHDPQSDPKPQANGGQRPHLHAHAVITTLSDYGERLNVWVTDLTRWRQTLAENARANGIKLEVVARGDTMAPPAYNYKQVRPVSFSGRTEHEATSEQARRRYTAKRGGEPVAAVGKESKAKAEEARKTWEELARPAYSNAVRQYAMRMLSRFDESERSAAAYDGSDNTKFIGRKGLNRSADGAALAGRVLPGAENAPATAPGAVSSRALAQREIPSDQRAPTLSHNPAITPIPIRLQTSPNSQAHRRLTIDRSAPGGLPITASANGMAAGSSSAKETLAPIQNAPDRPSSITMAAASLLATLKQSQVNGEQRGSNAAQTSAARFDALRKIEHRLRNGPNSAEEKFALEADAPASGTGKIDDGRETRLDGMSTSRGPSTEDRHAKQLEANDRVGSRSFPAQKPVARRDDRDRYVRCAFMVSGDLKSLTLRSDAMNAEEHDVGCRILGTDDENLENACYMTDDFPNISHLPLRKQQEIRRALTIIFEEFEASQRTKLADKKRAGRILKVVLFGSYARGDWVEDRKSGYRSDYDILVVVNIHSVAEASELWFDVSDHFLRDMNITKTIQTPVNVIVHTLQDVNDQLAKGRPFFIDIIRDGKILYEKEGTAFVAPKPLDKNEAKVEATAYYRRWSDMSREALEVAELSLERGIWRDAAFMLHQATERAYHCASLVLTLYSPKSHRLKSLRSAAEGLEPRLIEAWPRDTKFARRSFERLDRAYVDARYSSHYEITSEELSWVIERIKILQALVADVCEQRLGNRE